MAVGPQELILKPAGVVTDPNPQSAAPQGAMLEASNVVIERDGMVQPRPGFAKETLTGLSNARAIVPFDGDLLLVRAGGQTSWKSAPTTAVTDEDGNELTWTARRRRGAQSRRNLYITTADGVRKLTAAGETTAYRAGMPRPTYLEVAAALSGGVVPDGDSVAYRAVLERTDANGAIVTSAPSPRLVVSNTSGMGRVYNVEVHLPGGAREDDRVKLYRTPATTGTPDDEMYLEDERKLGSADISSGSKTIQGGTLDEDLGAALYTNASREGILQANAPIHEAKDLALYRGSLFLANTTGPQRLKMKVPLSSTHATGVGPVNFTGDISSGSADITDVSGTAGLEVGMIFNTTSGVFNGSGPVRITNISGGVGGTVTMSETANTTNTTQAFSAFDSVKIGSNYHPCNEGDNLISSVNSGSSDFRTTAEPDIAAYALDDEEGESVVVLEEIGRGGSAFEVWATHGSLYFPPLPQPPAAPTGEESTADVRPNAVMWSKRDEPEHIPELNYALVGSERHPIQRIVPTRDALYIFKTDGLWRLTGTGEASGWRIDPLDLSTILLVPETAQVLGEAVYGWTNRGVVRVTGAGVEEISDPYIDNELRSIERTILADIETTTYYGFGVAVPDRNSYLLAVPNAANSPYTDRIWVWNEKTRAWYSWDVGHAHGVLDPADNLLTFCGSLADDVDDAPLFTERRGDFDTDTVDEELASGVAVGGVSGDTIVVGFGATAPSAGDAILVTGETQLRPILEAEGPTFGLWSVTLADATGITDSDSVSLYAGYTSTMKFTTRVAGNPSASKHWRDGVWMFESTQGMAQATGHYTSDVSSTETEQTRSMSYTTTADRPLDVPMVVPREHARSTHLYPELEIRQGGANWRLSGLALSYVAATRRVRR